MRPFNFNRIHLQRMSPLHSLFIVLIGTIVCAAAPVSDSANEGCEDNVILCLYGSLAKKSFSRHGGRRSWQDPLSDDTKYSLQKKLGQELERRQTYPASQDAGSLNFKGNKDSGTNDEADTERKQEIDALKSQIKALAQRIGTLKKNDAVYFDDSHVQKEPEDKDTSSEKLKDQLDYIRESFNGLRAELVQPNGSKPVEKQKPSNLDEPSRILQKLVKPQMESTNLNKLEHLSRALAETDMYRGSKWSTPETSALPSSTRSVTVASSDSTTSGTVAATEDSVNDRVDKLTQLLQDSIEVNKLGYKDLNIKIEKLRRHMDSKMSTAI